MIYDVTLNTTGKMVIWDGTNTDEVTEFLGVENVNEVPVIQRLRIRIIGNTWMDLREGYAVVLGESGERRILTAADLKHSTVHGWQVVK